MMKAALQTEYIHTLGFYTADYQITYGLSGLEGLLNEASGNETKFNIEALGSKNLSETLKNIMPEALDEMSHQRIKEVCATGLLEPMDIRILLHWLVNKEILPAGSYRIEF